jgi:hypothetical protein
MTSKMEEAARVAEERARSDADEMRLAAAALDETRDALAFIRAEITAENEKVMSYNVT